MENKIKKAAVWFFLVNAVIRGFFLYSPLMSDVMPFEVEALRSVGWLDFHKDIFYIKLLSFFTDSMFLLRGFKFLISLVFVAMLFDVLRIYFKKESACVWGYLFFSVPPAFFSYQSAVINNSLHVLWIYILLLVKLAYPYFYGDKKNCQGKEVLFLRLMIFVFILIVTGLFAAYGSLSFFYMSSKHFFAEALPSMFGYFFSFRDYQQADRLLIFTKGLYIYFSIFFVWQSVFKNKNALMFFKGKFAKTNKTEVFFALFVLFALLVIAGGNSAFIKEVSYGVFYLSFLGMFCFFIQDVFSETKIFAVLLIAIVVFIGAFDNMHLLKNAYAFKSYCSAEKTATRLQDMNVTTVFADNDVWLPISFHLKKQAIKHVVLSDEVSMLPALSDHKSILLIHADRGVFSPRKIRQNQKTCVWEDEAVIGKYHIFS